jgi:hypothetical protein
MRSITGLTTSHSSYPSLFSIDQHRPELFGDLLERSSGHIAAYAHFHEAPDVVVQYGRRYAKEGYRHIVAEDDKHANAHQQRAPVALQGAFAFGFGFDNPGPAFEQLAFVIDAGAFYGHE